MDNTEDIDKAKEELKRAHERKVRRLTEARDSIKPLQTQADEERKSAKTNFENNVKYWKGKAFDKFKEERDTLNTYYNSWIRKGGSNDGSINGTMDHMNDCIGTFGAWIDSQFN